MVENKLKSLKLTCWTLNCLSSSGLERHPLDVPEAMAAMRNATKNGLMVYSFDETLLALEFSHLFVFYIDTTTILLLQN